MTFLHYICENDRVNSKELVHQYMKQFKMLYSRANGQRMDTNDGTDIYEVWQYYFVVVPYLYHADIIVLVP